MAVKNVKSNPWVFSEAGHAEGSGSAYGHYGTISGSTHGSDQVTLTAHGFVTGAGPVRLTGSDLPAGLSTGTDYWIIRVDADEIQFATSEANARAGTAVATSDDGSGTMTVTIPNSFPFPVYVKYITFDTADASADGTFSVLYESGGQQVVAEYNFVDADDTAPFQQAVESFVSSIYLDSVPTAGRVLIHHGRV
jgi:hypothetical protein